MLLFQKAFSMSNTCAPDFSPSDEEGRYDPITNVNGYAPYAELRPGQSLAFILEDIVIHHAGNRIGKSPFPTVGEIQEEQIDSRKYADIAYHYAIDNDANIYEGRPIGVRGAHVELANTGRIGVLFLRDFEPGPWWDVDPTDDSPPNQAQINAVESLVAALDATYGIDSVKGHNFFNDTECPGALLEPLIPQLDAIVKQTSAFDPFA